MATRSTARTTKHFLKIGKIMARICYARWYCSIQSAMGVLFSLLAVITAQQPGFLSIRCGGETNYTDLNNITWVTDAGYIDVGETADIGSVNARGSSLDSLRFFPNPLNKSCYQLPVLPNVRYLLRLWFVIGNYTGFQSSPSFAYSFETVDMLAMENITVPDNGLYDERILVTASRMMYVCLIRTSERDDPFITGIELRPLRDDMYAHAKPGTMLFLQHRVDAGGSSSTVRYPQDKFDRIWTPDLTIDIKDSQAISKISSGQPISMNNAKELPPLLVMQTAWAVNEGFRFSIGSSQGTKVLLMYFAELQTLKMSESRSFYISLDGDAISEAITLVPNYSALERTFVSNKSDNFTIQKAANSTRFPIINAYEYYAIINTHLATYSQDIEALEAIKRSFDIKDWVSDPCYVIPWKGIGCDNNYSSAIRISEMNLSGRNLTGSVPNDIVQLTGLVNVSLDNNNLIGSFPNFSKLTMLERLDLQNNNLSGNVPEWLSQMKNLKELNIENNNFRGVIPAQLLLNCSLNFNYSGNPHLRMDKRKCTPQNSNNNKLKVVLGIVLSGILIIALALTVGFIVYRKRIRRKEERITTRSIGVEMGPRPFLYQDYSMITVPNPTKSRAFTLDEMVAATQTFSREIGRGGFGSVFFGKLPEGKHIAVKVLSLFSHQGVHEFLNEVDLLSKINHRNLVSLLGYCNETREVMLIYDYMSGGSLRDHLYGPLAEKSNLNWKTRLKIALDAAQGLEYLHVGSTPKIIHRDIKTANILLDSRMNGKLSDFGLSRVTTDGEATHVTTAVKGTAGYLDPEYYNTQMLTEKSDVYSFGVVLLEIICGRPPIDLKLPVHELNIVRWVTPFVMEMDENGGKIREIIDKRLGGSYSMKSMAGVMKVGMRCVQFEPSCRPSVSEVVAELKEAINHEDISGISISEETGIASDASSAAPVSSSLEWSEPKAMEWSDNSSNIPKVGR